MAMQGSCRSFLVHPNIVSGGIHASRHRGFASTVVGRVKEPHLDLRNVRVGQEIRLPYDVTIGGGLRELWQSTFYQHDRLYTSKRFAQSLQLRDTVLPFSLMLFNAVSMSHVDPEREVLDLGLENAQYIRPAFERDTFHKTFTVKSVRPTRDGQDTVIVFHCEVFNQNQELVFSVDKAMMYRGVRPFLQQKSPGSSPAEDAVFKESRLYTHLERNSADLPVNSYLARLEVGELILHNMCRPVGHTANRSLNTSFRLTHPLLLNSRRYKDTELVVGGGLVLSATMAAASKCLYEVLTESVVSCSFLNRVHPQDLLGGITYIKDIRSIGNGNLQMISARTLGIRDCDIAEELQDTELPLELFLGKARRGLMEELVAETAPQLSGKLAVSVDRVLIRQNPFSQAGYMPLL